MHIRNIFHTGHSRIPAQSGWSHGMADHKVMGQMNRCPIRIVKIDGVGRLIIAGRLQQTPEFIFRCNIPFMEFPVRVKQFPAHIRIPFLSPAALYNRLKGKLTLNPRLRQQIFRRWSGATAGGADPVLGEIHTQDMLPAG